MEWVDHRCHLAQLLASGEAPADDWLEPLAGCVARLHDAQWFHRDLYLQHFLPRPASASPSRRPSLVLIDVARARHAQPVPRRWVVKDLAALLHSAPSSVRAALRRRFLGAYLDLREGRARLPAQRSLAREVLAKERRMAAHRPRWVDGEVRA